MDKSDNKLILLGKKEAELVEKKSRFIAHCFEIHSEEEALSYIEDIKKEYWDAKHNCYAFILGKTGDIKRFSDDKEPQGTAGKPILDCLEANSLTNTLIVVTRYFGGILLGTGGLTRAYSNAAAKGICASSLSKIYNGFALTLSFDYSYVGKLQFILSNLSKSGVLIICDTVYADVVSFEIFVEDDLYETLKNKTVDATSANCSFSKEKAVSFAVKDGSPVILDI